jgi:hypothetical protein
MSSPTLMYMDFNGFFQDEIQSILLQRHPSTFTYKWKNDSRYPILAYEITGQYAAALNETAFSSDFSRFVAVDPMFMIDLLKQLFKFNNRPISTAADVMRLYFGYRRFSLNQLPPPRKYFESFGHRTVDALVKRLGTADAVKKAIQRENNRRKKVMRSWKDSFRNYRSFHSHTGPRLDNDDDLLIRVRYALDYLQ